MIQSMKLGLQISIALLSFAAVGAFAQSEAVSLFDGKTLKGWKIQKGEEKWWRVEAGEIVGGSLDQKIPHNTFITTEKRYANFELNLKVKVEGSKNPNAGIQVRSERVPEHHEMIGYQADVGPGWWGKLYDESRRRKVIGDYVKPEVAKSVKQGEWNKYRIICRGKKIQLFINGVMTVDYTEPDGKIPLEGLIGLQTHGGSAFQVRYKDISIKELPADEASPKWEDLGEGGKQPWKK
ncbi:MAG: hypothetical protein ACI9UA_000283 [Pseudoalteromonas tetraodonis]|jgi:hypothetical protein